MPPPPPPTHILRTHSSPVTCLNVSLNGLHIYSGDASGLVIATSIRSLRPTIKWQPHSDSILGISEWLSPEGRCIITHGRDNKLHVWSGTTSNQLNSSAIEDLPTPDLCFTMDVNALSFCRFSLLQGPSSYIALPNLIDSSEIDIWSLPERDRIHAAIGRTGWQPPTVGGGRGGTGSVISIHLMSESGSPTCNTNLQVCAAYEFGGVILRKYNNPDKEKSVEGKGWDVIWKQKWHVDSVMAMKASFDNTFALSVSADNLLVKYCLNDGTPTIHRIKSAGHASISIRKDNKIGAIGGWDGRIHLYSTRTLKDLGTLKYHKEQCQSLLFLDTSKNVASASESEPESEGEMGGRTQENWLISGGKEGRIAIWSLRDFAASIAG